MGDSDGSIDIDVDPSFGAAPFTYLWAPTGYATQDVNNLEAGIWTVTVTDANGTTNVASYNVAEPSVPLVASLISTTQPTGNNLDGAINIGVSGGWGNYEYLWSNGAMSMDLGGLEEGSYTVTVTDAEGCESILSGIILEAIRIELMDFEENNIDCNGNDNGFVCVVPEGGAGPPYTFSWNTGETEDCIYSLEPDTYTVTVTDITGLTEEFSFDITEPDTISISAVTEPSAALVTASGGTAPYDYVWNTSPQVSGPAVTDQPTGDYTVLVTDANGCTALTVVPITEQVGGECDEVRTILSPNDDGKNEEFIILCARVQDIRLEVYNRWGQLVYEADNYDNTWQARDEAGNPLPEGAYYYVIKYDDEDEVSREAKGYITVIK